MRISARSVLPEWLQVGLFFGGINVLIALIAGDGLHRKPLFFGIATAGATAAFAQINRRAPGILSEPDWYQTHRVAGGLFSLLLAGAYLLAVLATFVG